jgi:hypothetical protein
MRAVRESQPHGRMLLPVAKRAQMAKHTARRKVSCHSSCRRRHARAPARLLVPKSRPSLGWRSEPVCRNGIRGSESSHTVQDCRRRVERPEQPHEHPRRPHLARRTGRQPMMYPARHSLRLWPASATDLAATLGCAVGLGPPAPTPNLWATPQVEQAVLATAVASAVPPADADAPPAVAAVGSRERLAAAPAVARRL